MNINMFTTLELASKNLEAFNALPEPYQNDDCLIFYIMNGILYCKPDDGEQSILGDWVAVYRDGKWEAIENGE